MNKLPAITLSFWIMKICATTLGETAGDLLSMTMNVGYAVSSAILLSFFFATLVVQLSTKMFHPIIYWSVILATSVYSGHPIPHIPDIEPPLFQG